MRVREWIVGRVRGRASGIESPIGWMPRYEDLRWEGIDFPKETFNKLMSVDRELWKGELLGHRELFEKLYDRLPQEFMWIPRELVLSALWRSDEHWRLGSEPSETGKGPRRAQEAQEAHPRGPRGPRGPRPKAQGF